MRDAEIGPARRARTIEVANSITSAWPRSSALSFREVATASLVLALLATVVFGSHVLNGGFYNDDWSFAVTTKYAPGAGFVGAVQAFDWMAFRPVAAVWWPLTHSLFGTNTVLHLTVVVALAVAMAGSLYVLLRTLGIERLHAFIIAALVLVFPAADSVRLWAASSISNLGIALYLLGTVVALRGLRSGGRRSVLVHGAAVLLYLLSVMSYEIAVGAVLLSVLLYRLKTSWRRALGRWVVDVAAVSTLVVLVTSNSWNQPQPLSTQLSHAWGIARQSAIVLTRSAFPFGTPRALTAIILFAAIGVAGFVVWSLLPDGDEARSALRRWLATGAAGVAAIGVGYAVFVPAAPEAYMPLMPGQHNRVNALAAVGYVIVVYSLVMLSSVLVLRGLPRWRTWSTAIAVAISLVIGFGYVRRVDSDVADWDRAWGMQEQILSRLEDAVGRPPSGATIYALGHAIEAAPGVPVFGAPWDLDGAVKLRWDDASLTAYPLIPGTTFQCGEDQMEALNSNTNFGGPQSAAYGNVFIVDIPRAHAVRVSGPKQCRSAAARMLAAAAPSPAA